jgi:hypothetical protein
MNLNIDFKEIYKILELMFSREVMFMDYVNNKFGLDIYYIDNRNNTNYATDDNNDGTEDMQDVVHNNSSNNNNNNSHANENQDNNAPSPVILNSIPRKIELNLSDTDDSADDEDVDSDTDSSAGESKDKADNPEYSKKSKRYEEAIRAKNQTKDVLRDDVDGYNEAVGDARKNLRKNARVIVEVDQVAVPNPLKRGREDSPDNNLPDYVIENRPVRKARFRTYRAKYEFLNDLSIAEEKKKVATKTLERLEKDVERLKGLTKSEDSQDNGKDN